MSNLKKLVEENGGINNARFIIDVPALDYTPAKLGLPFCFKRSSDELDSVSFKIDPDDLYGLDSNYKIKLMPWIGAA